MEALGRERVIGVLLPKGEQFDINVSQALVAHLGIKNYTVNIKNCYDGLVNELHAQLGEQNVLPQTITNLPARLRMAATYAVAQSNNGRVANTCNLSPKTDEENLGFTYAVLDRYIRTGEIDDAEIKAKIDRLHALNQFKLKYMDCFPYDPQ